MCSPKVISCFYVSFSTPKLLLRLFRSSKKLEHFQVKRDTIAQPYRPLCVISFLLVGGSIWVDEDIQGAAVDDQPRNKGTELGRGEEVDFEHGDGVWANRAVEESINTEFRN